MNRKDFQENFKTLVDDLVGDRPMYKKLNELADRFAKKRETIEKWYDGASVPVNATREAVVKHLYEEQKKREFAEAVREVIRNDLKIEIVQDHHFPMYEGDVPSFEVRLKLGDEVIYTEWASLQW